MELGCWPAGASRFRVVLDFLTHSPIEIKLDGWAGQTREEIWKEEKEKWQRERSGDGD